MLCELLPLVVLVFDIMVVSVVVMLFELMPLLEVLLFQVVLRFELVV